MNNKITTLEFTLGSIMPELLMEIYLIVNVNMKASLIQTSTIYNNNSDGTGYNMAMHGVNSNYSNIIPDGIGQNETDQSIYLLSHYELFNPDSPYIQNNVFGTNKISDNSKRQVSGTDYARAHNLCIWTNNNTVYWTRSAYDIEGAYYVAISGAAQNYYVYTTVYGTRPALHPLF